MSDSRSLFILVTQLELAGAQRVAVEQARYFWKKGYRVMLCFMYDKQGLWKSLCDREPYPVVHLGMKRQEQHWLYNAVCFVNGLRILLGMLRAGRYDILHTHTHYSNLIGVILGWLVRIPVRVATQHTSLSYFPQWFWRLAGLVMNLRCTSKIIAVSDETKQFCTSHMKVREDKVVVVRNGVDVEEYNPHKVSSSIQDNLRKSIGLSDGDPLILTVARLVPEKGHSYLLEAAAQVVKQRPDARFVFIGEGPLRSVLEEHARSLHLQDYIRFLGLREDVAELLSITSVFVLPAIANEAMPLSVLEAMASEVPVVVTAVGGVKEVIENGVSGLIVPPANSNELARSILKLLNDQHLSRVMGQNARERVMRELGWENTFAQYEVIYDSLLRR